MSGAALGDWLRTKVGACEAAEIQTHRRPRRTGQRDSDRISVGMHRSVRTCRQRVYMKTVHVMYMCSIRQAGVKCVPKKNSTLGPRTHPPSEIHSSDVKDEILYNITIQKLRTTRFRTGENIRSTTSGAMSNAVNRWPSGYGASFRYFQVHAGLARGVGSSPTLFTTLLVRTHPGFYEQRTALSFWLFDRADLDIHHQIFTR